MVARFRMSNHVHNVINEPTKSQIDQLHFVPISLFYYIGTRLICNSRKINRLFPYTDLLREDYISGM